MSKPTGCEPLACAIRGAFSVLLIAGVVSLISGCSSTRVREGAEYGPPGQTVSPTPVGPPLPPVSIVADPNSNPETPLQSGGEAASYGPVLPSGTSVALVLGPGLAKGFAYGGVLRSLHDSRIPVGALLGTEMGALIAALYATSETINEFEWKLMKLKVDVFRDPALSLSRVFRELERGGNLSSFLKETFGDQQIEQARLPLRVAIFSEAENKVIVLERGKIAPAIRAAFGDPSWLESSEWEGEPARSAAPERAFLIDEARAMALGPVVAVDVMDAFTAAKPTGKGRKNIEIELRYVSGLLDAKARAKDELGDADLVIRPDVRDLQYFDFSKRSTAEFRGKKATQQVLTQIIDLARRGDTR